MGAEATHQMTDRDRGRGRGRGRQAEEGGVILVARHREMGRRRREVPR